ncbi:hypothetical protein ACFP1I_21035 [Dyadobacter subterraneus]|uniref:Outer membrane protein beta-barrel domain-containing protein n=1 Tax=Dyadobacter subterraneus TaxID=2773304 RepID=A0ABR9WRE8_9BACT|nr:hypothetical protein [Dyadobacter subterraneus]MBE9466669.1 hypothetical protein [Dyadobacter subterraneus]
MKNFLLTLSIVFMFQVVKGQNNAEIIRPQTYDQKSPDFLQYRDRWNFKIGVGIGTTYRNKESFFQASTLSISAEPSYMLTNYISVGFRGEYTYMSSYISDAGRTKGDPMGSLSATADVIKLWNSKYAPFIGIGAGLYRLGYGRFPDKQQSDPINVRRENLGIRFGVSPRIGINLNSFSISLEMNLIDEKIFYNRDYMTMKIGYAF